jgi:putative SOS response-associated peptidase YedK
MCGRISLSTSPEELAEELELPGLPQDFVPRYNIAPSQKILAIVADPAAGRQAAFYRWGLVPFWAKDPSIGNRMINARAETVAEKPAFRNAFTRQRCLVPVSGFYEWKKEGSGKVPMHIRLASRKPFALAGLWEEWKPKSGAPIRSCTILTTTGNEFMAPIHDRMPVILSRDAQARWLDPTHPPADLRDLLAPSADAELEAWEVSTLVNSPANDVAECLEPA